MRARRRRLLLLEVLESRTTPTGGGAATDLWMQYDHIVLQHPGPSYTPAQIRHGYRLDQTSLTGVGQTIAIVDPYDHPRIASDLAAFDQNFGLAAPPSFVKVDEHGGTAYPPANDGWDQEIALDVEWAHAIAPGANLLLVEANSNNSTDLFAAITYARAQAGVVAVSMSWGASEFAGETFNDGLFTTPSGHIGGSGLPGGVTFIAATGDHGTVDAPRWPAISPRVVGVGGTSLTLDSAGNYLSEAGWSGSGGGVSQYEARPTYQSAVNPNSHRTNPDVSYNADPIPGFAVYTTAGGSGWMAIGGTSAGAPQWAALVALYSQARAAAGLGSLDGYSQMLPGLYALPGSFFHDILTGSNGRYGAGPGYDLVTGIGTPQGDRFTVAQATHFSVTVTSGSITAGTPFAMTVRALDAMSLPFPAYTGQVHLTSSDGTAALPGDYTFTAADAGVHTFMGLALHPVGTHFVAATDTLVPSVTGGTVVTTEYGISTAASGPAQVVVGPDGNLWFTEMTADKIARMSPAGTITGEYAVPTANSGPFGIAAGPDGNLWFTEMTADKIGRITPVGVVTEFALPSSSSLPDFITVGPDASLWFTEVAGNRIGRITPAGVITEFTVPTSASNPRGITTGPDGNMWFAEQSGNRIGRLAPGGTFSEFPIPTAGSGPVGLTAGADGNLWFTETAANQLGRITPGGVITEYPLPAPNRGLGALSMDQNGNLWFAEPSQNALGTWNLHSGLTEFPLPTAGAGLAGITVGPDGSLWVAESMADRIGRIQPALTISLAAANNLILVASPGASPGVPFAITLKAFHPYSSLATNLQGLVRFCSTDGAARLPAPYVYTAADNGVHTLTGDDGGMHTLAGSGTLITGGSPLVTITDLDLGIAGSIALEIVAPDSPGGLSPKILRREELGTLANPAGTGELPAKVGSGFRARQVPEKPAAPALAVDSFFTETANEDRHLGAGIIGASIWSLSSPSPFPVICSTGDSLGVDS